VHPADAHETCVFVGGVLDGQRKRIPRAAMWWRAEAGPRDLPPPYSFAMMYQSMQPGLSEVHEYRRIRDLGLMVLRGIPHEVLLEMLVDGYRGAPAAAPRKPATT